jgi:hypothetical protein
MTINIDAIHATARFGSVPHCRVTSIGNELHHARASRLPFFAHGESVFFARAEMGLDDTYVTSRPDHSRLNEIGRRRRDQAQECVFIAEGERYLVVRAACHQPTPCVRFVAESGAAVLLQYLADAHPETHETVIAAFLRWYREEISLTEFANWLETASIQPRSEYDDGFVDDLVTSFSDVMSDLSFFAEHVEIDAFARTQLQSLARLLEEFPPGLAADFDARAELAGEDAPRREDLQDTVRHAISVAQKSAAWRHLSEEVSSLASRGEGGESQ